MIRRGFWLAVGATGGIIGYRRVTALGRALASNPEDAAERTRQAGRGVARRALRLTRDARRFSRDVREGMDLYMVRHPGRPGSTLAPGTDTATDTDDRVKDDR